MSRIGNTILSSALILLAVMFAGSPAYSGKWQSVRQQDTDIRLENWPEELPCTYRDGGYDDRFAKKRSGVFCPRIPYHAGDRTYINVQELQAGYYWSGGISGDVRENQIFRRAKGYFAYFKSAKFPKGQDFSCYGSSRCQFRNIRFSVERKPCQFVHYSPTLGNMDHFYGPGDALYSVLIIHCGRAKPFMPGHISLKPGRVTITFPGEDSGSATPAGLATATAKICRLAMNRGLTAWHKQGFAEYVNAARRKGLTVADCRQVLEQAAKSDPTPASTGAPSPGDGGFTDCFDNPAACKKP